MSRKDEIYKPALAGKKIPILTLDNKWHKLFTQKKPDKKLRRLEEELNELLKKQGKLTSEIKDIKKLKKKRLDGIVANAEGAAVENDGSQQAEVNQDKLRFIRLCSSINHGAV